MACLLNVKPCNNEVAHMVVGQWQVINMEALVEVKSPCKSEAFLYQGRKQ